MMRHKLLIFLLSGLLALMASCGNENANLSRADQLREVLRSMSLQKADSSKHASREELIEQNKKRPVEERVESDLLDDFNKFAAGQESDQEISVIVLFVDDLQMPKLPSPDESQAKDSEYNTKVAQTIEKALNLVKEIRSLEIRERLKEIPELTNVEIIETHTIVNAVTLRMHLSEIKYLMNLPDVQHISYQVSKQPLTTP